MAAGALALAAAACGDAAGPAVEAGPRVAIAPGGVTLDALGELFRFEAVVFDATGGRVDDPRVTWESNTPTIATVDSTGTVRAVANGQATVIARWENLEGSAAVVVQQRPGSFAKVSGDFQDGIAGQPLPEPLVARVADKYGHPIAGIPVYFRVVFGSGEFDVPTPVSGADGIVSVRWTIPVPGEHTAQASLTPGGTTPAHYNATVR